MSKVQVGDQIKLKKEMGPFKKVGSICTIKELKDDGCIYFDGSDIPGCGVISEDELDKYFEIVEPVKPSFDDLESLDDDTLDAVIEGLNAQLEEYKKVAEERRKHKNFVQLDTLYIGDIFTYNEIEYKVISRLSNVDILIAANFKGLRIPYVMDSSTYVKRADDQD